jgi:hypothetical protein
MKNSVLNISVSGFANAKSTEPKPVKLLTWLTSDKYRQPVEAIRQAETKEERTRLKQSLPAITPSGTFTRRNLAGLVKHSGLLCLDIDHQDNKEIGNFSDLKKHLSNIQNFAFVGLSVSGAGYFCLVPIERPDLHKLHFEALQNDLRRFGIKIDNSGSDVTRLRFYSYDPEAYFNHQATVYSKLHQEPPPKPQRTQRTQSANNNSENHFQTLLNKITSTGCDITSGYQAWFEIGCGLANEFGEAGRSYFNDISRFNAGYKSNDTDRQFNHCLKHSYQFSIKTFFHYCQLHGVTLDKPETKPQRTHTTQRTQTAKPLTEIEKLKQYFDSVTLPAAPFKLNAWTLITDTRQFIESSILTYFNVSNEDNRRPILSDLKELANYVKTSGSQEAKPEVLFSRT